MPEPLSEQIIGMIDQAAELYHRLVLVVALPGSGKTAALQEVAERTGFRYININLELSRRLLDLTERQRTAHVQRLLDEIVGRGSDRVVLLDNLELLFDVALKLDPLRCLRALARRRTVDAAWNGTIGNGHLLYAQPTHRDYRSYPAGDLLIVTPQPAGDGQ